MQDDVFQQVLTIVNRGDELSRWKEQGKTVLNKRKQVLQSFITTISVLKAKPRRRRRVIKHEAIFQPGACIAITLPDGNYGAAIVLAADNTHKTEGMNLIGLLEYKGHEQPSPTVFRAKRWLKLTHHSWRGERAIYWCYARHFKKAATQFHHVGTVRLTRFDPKQSPGYTAWEYLITQIMEQDAWDTAKRA